MKTFFLFFACLVAQVNAQEIRNNGPEVTDAQFAGGAEQLSAFFSRHIRYPEKAAVRHIEGVVVVTFTVDATGAISNAKVRNGLGHGCDQEALRLVQSMPRWEPATINGRPVACGKTVRIDFRMAM
jgi:protein TonB